MSSDRQNEASTGIIELSTSRASSDSQLRFGDFDFTNSHWEVCVSKFTLDKFALSTGPTNDEPLWEMLCDFSEKIMKDQRTLEPSINDEWLNSKQAARYMKVSVEQLMNLTSSGQLPHYKMGRANRYLKAELMEFLLKTPKGKRRYD